MKRPVAISLSPNTDAADVALAWTVLLSPAMQGDGEILAHVAHMIARKFEDRFVVLQSSGRQALYDVLRVFEVGAGDEVIIQAFTCIAVAEPIVWTGAKPVYADVAKDSYTLDPQSVIERISPATKVIIVQHTFGIPGPIEEIMRIAQEKNIVVIEDCAHAFGSTLHGKPLGTFADAAFISFGRDKCLSSVYGGASIVKSRQNMERLRAYANKRSSAPLKWIMQQLMHPIVFSLAVPLYFVGGIGKALIVMCQRLGIISKAVEVIEKQGRRPQHISYTFPPALAQLLHRQLEKIDSMNARRADIAQAYAKAFAGTPAMLPMVDADASSSWLRFPLQVGNAHELLTRARQHNMLLGDWYDAVLVPSTSNMEAFSYKKGSCPNAEQLARTTINLPTYPGLTDTQVAEIISFIQAYAR